MDVDVVTRVTIDRPVADVAGYAGDPDNARTWYTNIRSVRWETDPPLRIAFVARFLGQELAYTSEVRELESDHRLVMATAEGPFPMETTYTWEPAGDQTLMSLRNRGRPRGFATIVAPVMSRSMRRANRQDLQALLEARGT